MPRALYLRPLAVTVGLFISVAAPSGLAAAGLNFAADGQTAATACVDYLAGKAPQAALAKAGFSTIKNKRHRQVYRKTKDGGGLPVFLQLVVSHKRSDASARQCSASTTLTTEREAQTVYNAFMQAFSSGGYRSVKKKTAAGRNDLYLVGPHGTYKATAAYASPLVPSLNLSITPVTTK